MDGNVEDEESEWKRDLRDKLKKGKGNEKISKRSFLREVEGDLLRRADTWRKRKLGE